jgi:hypothetical protein
MVETIKAQSEEYLSLLKEYHSLTKNWIWRCYGMGVAWTVLLITSAMLMMVPVSRLYFTAKINEFHAVKTTIENAREKRNMNDFELRGIQVVAAQWNGWKAYWKTWDRVPVVDFYIPDDIKSLEPIN